MTDVVMPQMGESIVEGTLTRWLKKPGEKVERDEPLFEISTDKVDTEIPSPAAGTLAEVLIEEGKTVGINTVVARIAENGASGAVAQAAPAPTQEAVQPTPAPEQVEEVAGKLKHAPPESTSEPVPEPVEIGEPQGPLSPLVRKMARELNIDLRQVKGTGANGRITKQDVESYVAQREQPAPEAPAAAPVAAPAPAPPVAAPPPPPPVAAAPAPAIQPLMPAGPARTRIEPLSTMRSKIASTCCFRGAPRRT